MTALQHKRNGRYVRLSATRLGVVVSGIAPPA